MKWTLEQYLQTLRERIDEVEDKENYKDSELTRYLNMAILDMTDDLGLKGIKIIPAPDSKVIDLDVVFEEDDRFASLDIVFIDDVIVPIKSVKVAKREGSAYQYGSQLVFPDVVRKDIECYYIKMPKTLENTMDTTDIPERWQAIPVSYAIALAKEKDEEWGQAREARSHYEQAKFNMRVEREQSEQQKDYNTIVMNHYGED